ncbi:MAG TPA: hypothetical protein VIK89_16635 [Cytophagaceae bacterium]
MKKILYLFIPAIACIFYFGCTDKILDMDIIEIKCKDFTISNPTYDFVSSAICGNDPNYRTVEITFKYNGDRDCIHLVEVDAKFVDTNDTEMSNITHRPLIFKTDSVISISNSTITFKYCYRFASSADTAALSYIRMNFHTENEQQNESNTIGVLIPIPGRNLHPKNYEIKETITVSDIYIDAKIYDDAAEDGDIISLNLNGKWVLENFTLTNEGHIIQLKVNPGENILIMYAINLGSSPPNTGAIEITDSERTHNVVLNSDMGKNQAIKIIY